MSTLLNLPLKPLEERAITCPHVDAKLVYKEGEQQTHFTLTQAACYGALIKLTQDTPLAVCDICWQVIRARVFNDVLRETAEVSALTALKQK